MVVCSVNLEVVAVTRVAGGGVGHLEQTSVTYACNRN